MNANDKFELCANSNDYKLDPKLTTSEVVLPNLASETSLISNPDWQSIFNSKDGQSCMSEASIGLELKAILFLILCSNLKFS